MTVSTTTNRINALGTGALTTFPYPFRVFAASNLSVYVAGVLQTFTTHYTVTGVGEVAGGNVVFEATAIPALAASVVIIRTLPLTQLTDYVEGDPFPAETHEAALDRLIMIDQQFEEKNKRFIVLPVTSLLTNIELPVSAGNPVKWNAGATGLEAYTIGAADALNVITEHGDIIFGGAAAAPDVLHHGTAGMALTTGGSAADPAWAGMTTQGDVEYHNGTTRATLGHGTAGQCLVTGGHAANPSFADRLRRITFPASSLETRIAAGYAVFTQTQGTNYDWGIMSFPTAADSKANCPPFRLSNWDGVGNIIVRIAWKANAIAGNVAWVINFTGIADGEPFDAAVTAHAVAADTVSDVAEDINITTATIAAPAELAENDTVMMTIHRDVSEDDMAADAKLLYLELEYSEGV